MLTGRESRREGGAGFWRGGPIASGFRHEDVLPRLTDEAVAVLERHSKESPDKRFFLYLALTAPHTPWPSGMRTQAGFPWKGPSTSSAPWRK